MKSNSDTNKTEETDQSDVLSHGAQDEGEYRNGIDDK